MRAPLPLDGRFCRATARRWLTSALTVLLAILLSISIAPSAVAWSPKTQQTIAADAARLAPPDLARQLERHAEELAAGALEPFSDHAPKHHVGDRAAGGELDRMLRAEVAETIEAIRDHRGFAEVARRLGRVAHWSGDLSNPLNAASTDPEEPRYFRDFLLYAEAARPRFAVVVYEWRPPLRSEADVERLVSEGLDRGRRLYPLLGSEYRRIGFESGRRRFDDRSTAFALASIAYSHAVTDTARLYRYIWLAAGGVDPRSVFAHTRDRVLVLDQGGAP